MTGILSPVYMAHFQKQDTTFQVGGFFWHRNRYAFNIWIFYLQARIFCWELSENKFSSWYFKTVVVLYYPIVPGKHFPRKRSCRQGRHHEGWKPSFCSKARPRAVWAHPRTGGWASIAAIFGASQYGWLPQVRVLCRSTTTTGKLDIAL